MPCREQKNYKKFRHHLESTIKDSHDMKSATKVSRSLDSPPRNAKDDSIDRKKAGSILEPLLKSTVKNRSKRLQSGSSDLGYTSKSILEGLVSTINEEQSRASLSRASLDEFDPKPLREFFSSKQPQIRVMVMKDDSEEPAIYNMRLMDLHENLVKYSQQQFYFVNRINENSPGIAVNVPSKPEPHIADFEKILELRGRDLFCIAKPAGEVDIPVVLIRQYMCVICARYDMRAIIQSDRIIFIGQSPDDTFEGVRRHMQVFLRRGGSKHPSEKLPPVSEGSGDSSTIRESILNHHSAHCPANFSFEHDIVTDGVQLDGFPFEIRAYEGLLATVIGAHRNECEMVAVESEPFFDILDADTEETSSSYLGSYSDQARLLTLNQHQKLRRLKESIIAILARVKFTSTMIRELLEDKLLPFLCLSDVNRQLYQKYNAAHSFAEAQQVISTVKTGLNDRVDDVEFLLEHHLTECLQLEFEAANILRRMESAEQDILIRLNVSQTQVLIANVFISVFATCIALGAFIAGLFGMNLDNVVTIQEVEGSFAIVSGSTVGLITGLAVVVILILQYSAVLPSTIRLRQQQTGLTEARSWNFKQDNSGRY